MLHKLLDLKKFTIDASDGRAGVVKDVFFQEDTWVVRYLVVDTGGWITGREVLVVPAMVEAVDWQGKHVHVRATRDQIERAPGVALDQPPSRELEQTYFDYYSMPYYWHEPMDYGRFITTPSVDAATAQSLTDERLAQIHDSKLRSAKETAGYKVQCKDSLIGHLDDFVVDDESWGVRYVVVDTGKFFLGHNVLLATHWVEDVDWQEEHMVVDLTSEQVKDAPEFDPAEPLGREYEESLHGHYGKTGYWSP
jgi:hypothetical protein